MAHSASTHHNNSLVLSCLKIQSSNSQNHAHYDAAAHEYSTGLSRIDVARNHGIAFTIAPDLALIDGIDAARNLIDAGLMKRSALAASRP